MILGSYLLFGFLLSVLFMRGFYIYSVAEMVKNNIKPSVKTVREAQFLLMGITTITWGILVPLAIVKLLINPNSSN